MEQVVGKIVEDNGDAPNNSGDYATVDDDDEGDPHAASARAPQVGATQDYDFITSNNQGVAGATTLNPRLSGNQDKNVPRSNYSMVPDRYNLLYAHS